MTTIKTELTLEDLNAYVDRANANGSGLYLNGLTAIPEGFNPTVGENLCLNGLTLPERAKARKQVKKFASGDYVPNKYLYADGVLTHVEREKKIGEYTLYVGKIPSRNVVSDGKRFAHCKNFREGIEDLAFKAAEERGAEQYKNIDLQKPIPLSEAVQMYRVITGACRAGTQDFISRLNEVKEAYTVAEMIKITEGQYGSAVFANFFEKEM